MQKPWGQCQTQSSAQCAHGDTELTAEPYFSIPILDNSSALPLSRASPDEVPQALSDEADCHTLNKEIPATHPPALKTTGSGKKTICLMQQILYGKA